MLIIKSYGAYIIDHARKSPENFPFIFGEMKKEDVDVLVEKNRPAHLFDVRGRTGIKSKTERSDIGILDKPTFESLSRDEQEDLCISGLEKTRPLFRTFTHEADGSGYRKESIFVNHTFNNDLPLIGSISGSTSCILVGANMLIEMNDEDKKALAIAATAFLVGGGYHSATEVLALAYPGLDFFNATDQRG